MHQLIENSIRKIGICSVIGSLIFLPLLALHEEMIGGFAAAGKFEDNAYYVAKTIDGKSGEDIIISPSE